MVLITDATLANNDNSKTIFLRGLGPTGFKRSQPATAIPIVNAKPQNNVLFRFFGQTDVLRFKFVLVDDGTDVANGTHSSAVTTIDEQMDYLKEEIFTEDYDVDWTIIQSRYAPSPGITGVIEDMEVQSEGGSPSIAKGTMVFKRGNIGAL